VKKKIFPVARRGGAAKKDSKTGGCTPDGIQWPQIARQENNDAEAG